MPQPTPYARAFDFSAFEAASPAAPPPGPSLDAEFNAIAVTARTILANLAMVQRDDGALKNLIVTLESLSPAVLLAFGAGGSWVPRGAWATITVYGIGDVVTVGTQSWVNAVAHTSLATFAADNAASRWVLLFDTAGTIPADGSVTSVKFAPGAVDTAAVGFTSLNLPGALRGVGGVAAGTAPFGSLMHAKLPSGPVYGRVERATDAQGPVGYEIIGVGATWAVEQGTTDLGLSVRKGNAIRGYFSFAGGLEIPAGEIRSTPGTSALGAGPGVGLQYVGSTGYIQAYDNTLLQWRDLKVRGKDVYLTAAGIDVLKATATGVDVMGTLTRNGNQIGYLGLPQNVQSGAYTLALADQGGHLYSENVAGQVVTVPLNATVAFPIGTAIVIVNDGSNPITLTPDGTVQLRLGGTASVGARTLAAGSEASLLKVKADRWFVSGVGVS